MSISAVEKYGGEKWHAVAAAIKPEVAAVHRRRIRGRASRAGGSRAINPATGEVIAEVAEGTARGRRPRRRSSASERLPVGFLGTHGSARSDGGPLQAGWA